MFPRRFTPLFLFVFILTVLVTGIFRLICGVVSLVASSKR